MKRLYADLHLCPDLRSEEQVLHVVRKACELGYGLIAVRLFPDFREERIKRLRNMCEEDNVDFVSRLDLKPRTPKELIRSLRRYRRRFEVIGVMCDSKGVARQAAKDRRVDILNFPSHSHRKRFFDEAEAELASKALACFEININPLLTLEGPARIRLISRLRREVAMAEDFQVPIVVSSGASTGMLMRKPREIVALTTLFDLEKALAEEAISRNPLTIVERNREKLSSEFVAPGIKLSRRGKDC